MGASSDIRSPLAFRQASDGGTELRKAVEQERGDHGSLPDRGRNALRRPVPDVARREQAHAAGLEWKRITIERPALRAAAVDNEVLAGEDVAGGVGQDVLARAPVGM